MRVDVGGLEALAKRLESPAFDDAIQNAFYNSLDDTVADGARMGHAFTNRTFLTERSIYTEVDKNVGSVFVPVQPEADKVGVHYVEYLVNYDPFLDIALDKNINKFSSQFEKELADELEEVY